MEYLSGGKLKYICGLNLFLMTIVLASTSKNSFIINAIYLLHFIKSYTLAHNYKIQYRLEINIFSTKAAKRLYKFNFNI